MCGKAIYRALTSLFIFTLVLAMPVSGKAQSGFHVQVDYLDNSKFPLVEAYLSVSDANGLPVENLTKDMFVISEDNRPVVFQDFAPVENMTQPLAIALLMDTSASMGSKELPTPLQKSVEAAKSFVDQLAPQDQVAIIKFSDTPEVVLDLTSDKNAAKQALDALKPEKSKTVMFDALVEGVKTLQSHSGRRIIVLVTDGKDTNNGLFDFDSATREAKGASIPIFPLGFGNVINVQQLQRMAELTGGSAQIQPSVSNLKTSFDTVLRILREQYKVSYISNLPADNTEHELLATVNYLGGQEQATYQFIAKSSVIPVSLPGFQEGQVTGGLVRFAPLVDWPAPLKSLDITVDGTLLTSVIATPFEYEWNSITNAYSSGVHEFVFKATDVAGNTGQASINLNVQPPITVSFFNLQDGQDVGKPLKISADVTTLVGIAIQRVEILVDDRLLSTLTAPPYEAEWNVAEYPAGPHKVSVVAYDAGGLFQTKDEVDVNVQVGSYSWMIPIVVLAIAGLIVPFALRSRRKGSRAGAIVSNSGGQAVLREIEGMNPGQAWPLGSSEIRLGRKRDENEIPLKGLKASRRHATIRMEQGQHVIYNLSQTSPTLVNDVYVSQKQVLRPGDVIQLGDSTLRYEG